MTDVDPHPRHQLDDVIHAPVRLSILAALAKADKLDFRFLRDTIEVSDSLLSKHLTTLEASGYIEITKGRLGRRTQTWIRMTAAGASAFDNYRSVLRSIVEAGQTTADGR